MEIQWTFALCLLALGGPASAKRVLDVELQKIVYTNRTDGILIDFTGLKLKRFNKTCHAISGEFEVLKDIGNDAQVKIDIYQMQGNEYRKTPYHIAATPFCKFARDENMPYMELVAYSDLPPPETCPLPAGKYTIKDLPLSSDRIPDHFDGKYMAEQQFIYRGSLNNKAEYYTEIHPYEVEE